MQKNLNSVKRKNCYVVLLNYNSWKDTIECLESLLKSDYENYRVIVCEHASENDSWKKLLEWASGDRLASCSDHPKIQSLVYPFVSKPIDFDCQYQEQGKPFVLTDKKVHFIRLKRNVGFAGGMNVCIRMAMQDEQCGYIWCLNNDTVVEGSVMKNMIQIINENRDCGICSSCSRSYNNPDYSGDLDNRGYVNKWFGNDVICKEPAQNTNVLFCFDGASFMVRREFIEEVGLMEESYFLYHEEPDWTIRGAQHGYRVIFYPEGFVYHKGGKSTNETGVIHASEFADYCMIRSRILFMKKFYPYHMPFVYLGLLLTMFHRLQRRQYRRIGGILRIMLNPRKKITEK